MIDKWRFLGVAAAMGLALSGLTGCSAKSTVDAPVTDEAKARPDIGIWLAPESPPKIWENGYGKAFPIDMIAKDIRAIGCSDVFFSFHDSRGGPVYYNTSLPGVNKNPRMVGDRDWLEDTLAAADKNDLRVWITLTPSDKFRLGKDKTGKGGLGDPDVVRYWSSIMDEVATKYLPRHKSLYGVMFHELNCAEAYDTRSAEVPEFSRYCADTFGEAYAGEAMPDLRNDDKWTRRYYLFKAKRLTDFCREISAVCRKHGLKTAFVAYSPESSTRSALWGYDFIDLEKTVDRFWVSPRGYYDLKGAWVDISLSYKDTNVPGSMTRGFHPQALSVFEHRAMLYPEVVRAAFRKNEEFTKTYGDIFEGRVNRSQKVLDLFHGPANMKKWLGAHARWIGGESAANVAVMCSSMPYVLRYPATAGIAYKRDVESITDALEKTLPAERQLIGSQYARNMSAMRRYALLVIPENMGLCLAAADYAFLREYMKQGGKVLAIGSAVSTANADLTGEIDRSAEMFGVRIENAPPKKNDDNPTHKVVSLDAEIAQKSADGTPLLTRKGGAYYLAMNCLPENAGAIAAIVRELSAPPVSVSDNNGFEICPPIRKNNMLCAPLFSEKTPGTATLRVNASAAGLVGDRFEIRDIVTGKTFGAHDADALAKGVKVQTRYHSQPFVLAIGQSAAVAAFAPLYPDETVFADMDRVDTVENPEVAMTVPGKPGLKVGIYQGGVGAAEIYATLNKIDALNCFLLPRLDADCVSRADVIIVPQPHRRAFYSRAMARMLPLMVEKKGKGLLLIHDAALVADKSFPNVIAGVDGKIRMDPAPLKVAKDFPGGGALKPGDEIVPGFRFDHYALKPGPAAKTLLVDAKDRPVALGGQYGKGRVIVAGSLIGAFSAVGNPEQIKGEIEGKEKDCLLDFVNWLR